MIKKEFIKFYADNNNIENLEEATKDVEDFLETMKEAFKKYPKITFRNFGVFEVRETKARKIVDPRGNNEIIEAKPRKYVKFRVSKNLADDLYEEK